MQNPPMATNPDKPGDSSAAPKSARVHDFFMEPLPVPDAVESNGDTVWGMWEDSLQERAPGASEPASGTDFEKTQAAPLGDLPD